MWEKKQGSNSPPFDKSPEERKPTVLSVNVACYRKLEMAVTMIPAPQALAHLPTAWLICPGQALSWDLEQKQSVTSEVVSTIFLTMFALSKYS